MMFMNIRVISFALTDYKVDDSFKIFTYFSVLIDPHILLLKLKLMIYIRLNIYEYI